MSLTRTERTRLGAIQRFKQLADWATERFEQPIDILASIKALSVLLLLAMVAFSFVNSREQSRDQEAVFNSRVAELEEDLTEQQALNDCRSSLAAEVAAATTEMLQAMGGQSKVIGALVVAVSNRDDASRPGILVELTDAGMILDKASVRLTAASAAREHFEVTQECPQ